MVGTLIFRPLINLQFVRRAPIKIPKQAFYSLSDSCAKPTKKPKSKTFVLNSSYSTNSLRRWARQFSTVCTPENEVESHSYTVKTFGKITIKSPFRLQVEPLKPLDYPDMNIFICEIFDHNDSPSKSASGFHKCYGMDVSINDKKDIVNVDIKVCEGIELPLTCSIKIPIKFNINIESEKEPVCVNGFEADNINISTNEGNCYLQKLKCGDIKVVSQSGNIESATLLQGNIDLKTGNAGSISGDRFQGQNIKFTTEHGGVDIKSLYADKTHIKALSGTTHLGNCHGTTNIDQSRGKISIDSASGELNGKINQGDIAAFVADCGRMYLNTNNGDIDIKILESIATNCHFEGQSVEISDSISHNINTSTNNSESNLKMAGTINGGSDSSSLTVKAKQGKIKISQQDWISSLNLSSKR